MMVGWFVGLLFGGISGWSLNAGALLLLTFILIFMAGCLWGATGKKVHGEDLKPFFAFGAAIEFIPFTLFFSISSWGTFALKLLVS